MTSISRRLSYDEAVSRKQLPQERLIYLAYGLAPAYNSADSEKKRIETALR